MNRRKAFTLIELLVAIGVMLVLVGIVFVGMSYVGNSSRGQSTKVTMGNLQSMLSALDAQSRQSLEKIDAAYTLYINSTATSPLPLPLPTTSANVTLPENPDTPPGPLAHRYDPFVCITGTIAMQAILSLPENKAALAKLSPKMLQSWLKPDTTTTPPTPPPATNILLDAWGNPIIYVPASGLQGVVLAADTNDNLYLVQSNGVTSYPKADTPPPKSNARPFWASAGPDGDFVKGDDNIYSFEK